MSYTIDIKGLKELQANIDKLPAQLKKEAGAILENGAKNWVLLAKRDAPVDVGFLKGQISYSKNAELSFSIVSGSEYAAYPEWGTITFVAVPPQLQAYAIQFKGKGIRKTGGMRPTPYFFKQQAPVTVLIERGLNSILKEVKL